MIAQGSELVNWLNANSGAVNAVAVAILVLVTAFYAWQTTQLAQETKHMAAEVQEQRLDSQRPVIDVHLRDPADGELIQYSMNLAAGILPESLKFSVRNIGSGPALDVRLRVIHPSRQYNIIRVQPEVKEEKPYDSQFEALAASQEQAIWVAVSGEPLNNKQERLTPLSVRIEYHDLFDRNWLSQRDYRIVLEDHARIQLRSAHLEADPLIYTLLRGEVTHDARHA